MLHHTSEIEWLRGERIPGVAFGPGSHVRILDGSFADDCGCVRGLLALEPEPEYAVEVDGARVTVELPQSAIDTA